MKLKELVKQIQETNLKNLSGIQVMGWKTFAACHTSGKYKYKSLYAHKKEGEKTVQIYLGKPETVEDIEERIKKYCTKEHRNK